MSYKFFTAAGLACVLLHLPSMVFAGASDIEGIKQIYSQTNNLLNEKTSTRQFYYLSREGWKSANVTSPEKLADIDKNSPIESCQVFLVGGDIVKVLCSTDTPSGDWSSNKEYYFHPNGSTAFVFERYLTFNGYDIDKKQPLTGGPFIIEIRHYYSKSGTHLRTLKKAYAKKDKGIVDVRYLPYVDLGIISKIADFPFQEHLKRE